MSLTCSVANSRGLEGQIGRKFRWGKMESFRSENVGPEHFVQTLMIAVWKHESYMLRSQFARARGSNRTQVPMRKDGILQIGKRGPRTLCPNPHDRRVET